MKENLQGQLKTKEEKGQGIGEYESLLLRSELKNQQFDYQEQMEDDDADRSDSDWGERVRIICDITVLPFFIYYLYE